MRRFFIAMGVCGAAAVLAACDGASVAQTSGEEAVLCPGGADCPEDDSYVGLLLPADSTTAAAEIGPQLAGAPAAGEAAPGVSRAVGGGLSAQGSPTRIFQPNPPNPPRPPFKRMCPGSPDVCWPGQSGLEWVTASTQIQCDPARPCVPGRSYGTGNGNGPPMPAGYKGWLCKKTPTEDCRDLPQRR